MALIFSAPGKTFLAGEYLALDGGMTLLAMTEPRFELRVSAVARSGAGLRKAGPGSGRRDGIPAGSPADRLIARHEEFFSRLDLAFHDPHAGQGGWGASTAQYLTLFALLSWRSATNDEAGRELDTKLLLDEYKKDAWNGEGRAPSGADLIGQMKGGFCFFEKQTGMISRTAWPFENLDGFLIRTGVKVPTHEHLKTLAELDTAPLAEAMVAVREAWNKADGDGFAEGLKSYNRVLQQKRLVTENTLSLLHDLLWMNGVKAAKGCGALGADVVFALVEKNIRRSFEIWAGEKGLEAICLREKTSDGLALKVEGGVELGAGGWL